MKIWLYRAFSAFTFLTKIPIPYNPSINDEDFQRNIVFFPLVGSVLGIMLYMVLNIIMWRLSPLMSAGTLLAFYVILTGGLHLDGVGDSFDGLFSYKDKPKILEVMKDPRMGSNGVLGILLILGIKLLAMNDLLCQGDYNSIILMPFVGRISLVIACYKGRNARENGMGKTYIGNITSKDFMITGGISILILALFIIANYVLLDNTAESVNILLAVFLCILYVFFVRSFAYKKIDGITGDILGLVCESSEALFLVFNLFLV